MSFLITLIYVTFLYIRPGELWPELASYRIMVWTSLLGILLSAINWFMGRRFAGRTAQVYLMLALMTTVMLSVAMQGWLGGAIEAFQQFSIACATFFLIASTVTSIRRLRILAQLLVFLSLIAVAQGVLAYEYGYRDSQLVVEQRVTDAGSPSDSPAVIRRIKSLGLFSDPNDFAQALLTVLPFLPLLWSPAHPFRRTILTALAALFILYGVYLTRSRGAVISLVILAFLACSERFGRGRGLALSAGLGAFLIALNFTGGRSFAMDESAYGRLDAWSAGLMMLRSSPILGVGFRNFTDYHDRTAHSSLVLCFAELGLVGYFFWLALIVLTIRELSLVAKLSNEPANRELSNWARAIRLALITYLLSAIFLSRTYADTLYLILALAAALVGIARRTSKLTYRSSLTALVPQVAALEVSSILLLHLIVKFRWSWAT